MVMVSCMAQGNHPVVEKTLCILGGRKLMRTGVGRTLISCSSEEEKKNKPCLSRSGRGYRKAAGNEVQLPFSVALCALLYFDGAVN